MSDEISNHPRELHSAPSRVVRVDGRELLYFGGTGYLGLQGHPEVIEAGCAALRSFGLHAATSRAFYGSTPPLREVERALAAYFDVPAAFSIVSGYAGAMILARIAEPDVDRVFLDDGAHACVVDAAQGLALPVHRFAHASAAALAESLAQSLCDGERPLVMSDAVDALRGSLVPLDSYRDVLMETCGDRPSTMIVDDAHGVGVLGANGHGTLEHFGLPADSVNRIARPGSGPRVLRCATASKALGGYGGCIVGDAEFVTAAQRASHWYDGASPLPPAVSAATAAALRVAMREPERRGMLASNVSRVRRGLKDLGLPIDADAPTPAIGFSLADAEQSLALHRRLDREGVLVPYSQAYGGDDAVGVLRIAVFATHTPEDLDRLLSTLAGSL